nr:MAG TPA: Sorting nexin-17, P-selectin domain, PROTEIN TRANSPORT-CELL ADHESION.8A [Caudoviricetes sp.]
MDANLNEYHERVVLSNDIIIKVYSSDREDGCPKNNVTILYRRKFTDSFYILPFHQHLGNYHVYVNTSYM